MKRVLIAGVGSHHLPDTAGWMVIDQLKGRFSASLASRVVLAKLQTPLDLLDYVDHQPVDSEDVLVAWILIDACIGLASGCSHRWIWPEIPQEYSSKSSTHALGLLDTLQLAETLGNLPSEVAIYGVGVDGLGRSIEDCIKALGHYIDQLLA